MDKDKAIITQVCAKIAADLTSKTEGVDAKLGEFAVLFSSIKDIVFDEIFGKISNDNLEMVSEFFIKIKEYFDNIFLISHNPMINQWADTIVKIKKEDNISRVYQ